MNIRESTKSVYSSIGKNSSVNVAELAIRGVSNAASKRKNIRETIPIISRTRERDARPKGEGRKDSKGEVGGW